MRILRADTGGSNTHQITTRAQRARPPGTRARCPPCSCRATPCHATHAATRPNVHRPLWEGPCVSLLIPPTSAHYSCTACWKKQTNNKTAFRFFFIPCMQENVVGLVHNIQWFLFILFTLIWMDVSHQWKYRSVFLSLTTQASPFFPPLKLWYGFNHH